MFRWAVGEGLIPPEVPQALAMVPGLRKGHTAALETKKVLPVELFAGCERGRWPQHLSTTVSGRQQGRRIFTRWEPHSLRWHMG
jgi:hypothetical protein